MSESYVYQVELAAATGIFSRFTEFCGGPLSLV
jgi:hypothetical protein